MPLKGPRTAEWLAVLALMTGCSSSPSVTKVSQAVIGGSGAGDITPGTTAPVNTYYLPLAADASAGAISIKVTNTGAVSTFSKVVERRKRRQRRARTLLMTPPSNADRINLISSKAC